jgi:ketosteroid isomerase-like protein
MARTISRKKPDPDEAAIRALDAEWGKAATAQNLADVIKFYATDASLVWPDMPPATGIAAIRASWKNIYKEMPGLYLDFQPIRIDIASGRDLATDFGLVHFKAGAKPKDPKNTAKYLVIWKRERGVWKVFYDCWNWNTDPAKRS